MKTGKVKGDGVAIIVPYINGSLVVTKGFSKGVGG
jgi:hypothetical protein